MAFQSGFVDDTGALGIAHKQMLPTIKTLAEANGWVTKRYKTDVPASHELILQGEGLSGTEQIFIGFRTYDNVDADYYNLTVAAMIGYVPGNVWAAQPGILEMGIPAHNQRIDYHLQCEADHINLGMKLPVTVCCTGGAGKYYSYEKPSQNPLPLYISGMLNGPAATRYSDTAYTMGWRGSRPNFRVRGVDSVWKQPDCWPWNNAALGGTTSQLRDTAGQYPGPAIVINDASPNHFGEIPGMAYVSNFDNTFESTVNMNGADWICLQDSWRTGFNDYIAMRMS